ncbi:hypothetical protein VNO77_35458 [Canavalia gladiata]|uniref:Uncharacterized protein n=1 Tax=Canavalia gladiata TaxID=3824 RepID=A0AAN9PXR7_CANGL
MPLILSWASADVLECRGIIGIKAFFRLLFCACLVMLVFIIYQSVECRLTNLLGCLWEDAIDQITGQLYLLNLA